MKNEDKRSSDGMPEQESELLPLLQRLDALCAMIGTLAESNAALAAAVVDMIAAEYGDEEQEHEPEEEVMGGYVGQNAKAPR